MRNSFRDMNLEPKTAEEIKDCETPDGMRRRIHRYSYSDAFTHQLLDASYIRGLSGEDTMTWLAFEALKRVEYLQDKMFERASLEPFPPTIFKNRY